MIIHTVAVGNAPLACRVLARRKYFQSKLCIKRLHIPLGSIHEQIFVSFYTWYQLYKARLPRNIPFITCLNWWGVATALDRTRGLIGCPSIRIYPQISIVFFFFPVAASWKKKTPTKNKHAHMPFQHHVWNALPEKQRRITGNFRTISNMARSFVWARASSTPATPWGRGRMSRKSRHSQV